MSSFDPEKGQDTDQGISSAQVMIETEVTSLEEITSPQAPSVPSSVDENVSASEDKIDAMQTRTNALEKETQVLKERLASPSDLKKLVQTRPSLQGIIVDEAHKLIFASRTVLLAYINTYILGPVQKLEFSSVVFTFQEPVK